MLVDIFIVALVVFLVSHIETSNFYSLEFINERLRILIWSNQYEKCGIQLFYNSRLIDNLYEIFVCFTRV